MFVQGFGLLSPMQYLNAGAVAKDFPDASYIKIWNQEASKWPKIKSGSDLDRAAKKLKVGFNSRFDDTDRRFWFSYMIQIQEMPHLKQAGDTYEFWSPNNKEKLLGFKVEGEKYTFEGGSFVYNKEESLEKNFVRLKKVLRKNEVSFFESFFLPRAQAGGFPWLAIGAAALTFIVVRGFQTDWQNFKSAGDKHQLAKDELKKGNIGDAAKNDLNAVGTLFTDGSNGEAKH